MKEENKIIKLISGLLIILIILPSILLSIPEKGHAMWGVMDTTTNPQGDITSSSTSVSTTATAGTSAVNLSYTIKSWVQKILEEVLKMIAKKLLAKITQSIVTWINNDFHGSPLFIENPESFFADIGKSEIKRLIDTFGYDPNRFPFGRQFALNAIASYKSQLATNMQYTLSKVINDPALLRNYRNNFNAGGWNGFLINTQYPQNNYLGFQMLASEELARRLEGTVQTAAQKVQTTLQQGMGFLSPQKCIGPNAAEYNNFSNQFVRPSFRSTSVAPEQEDFVLETTTGPTAVSRIDYGAYEAAMSSYNASVASEREQWAKTNECKLANGQSGLVNTTPGSVVADQIMTGLNIPTFSKILDAGLGNSLAAILDALINKVIEKGLNGMSAAISSISLPTDNWNFEGQTLHGGTVSSGTTATNATFNIPKNISVKAGKIAIFGIYGGKAGYSIKTKSNETKAITEVNYSSGTGYWLEVAGIAPGTTTVTIEDSSTPSTKTAVINITVNNAETTSTVTGSTLTLNPTSKSTEIDGEPILVNISGGVPPYFFQKRPLQTIAQVSTSIAGATFIVIATGKGNDTITIKDSSTPTPLTATFNIEVKVPNELNINPTTLEIRIGQTAEIPISGGTIGATVPYTITNPTNTSVAKIEILPTNPNIMTVTGLGVGGPVMFKIEDFSAPTRKFAFFSVSSPPPLGNCHKRWGEGSVNIQTPQAECINTIGGSWTENPALTTSQSHVVIETGETRTINISGGTRPYTTINPQNQNTAVATTNTITDVTRQLIITGVGVGTSQIDIQDNSNPYKNTSVYITVRLPLGDCRRNFTTYRDSTKPECDARGAQWQWTGYRH